MITVVGLNGQEWKIKSATANGVTFVRHEDLEAIAVKEGVEADYDSLGEDEKTPMQGVRFMLMALCISEWHQHRQCSRHLVWLTTML